MNLTQWLIVENIITVREIRIMKKGTFNKVTLLFCVVILSSWAISVAVAGKPADKGKPSFTYSRYSGYVMLRDGNQDLIRSDNLGEYADCGNGGTDLVEVGVWDDGTFKYVYFYPGVMEKPFYECDPGTFSTRRVKFHFNVSGIPISQEPPAGDPAGNAVQQILRWYRDAGVYKERSVDGFITDNSLHAPICVYRTGHSKIQFVIDPAPTAETPGSDPEAVTQESVDDYYATTEDNVTYWCTSDEPAPYVIYHIEYDKRGFEVEPVDWDADGKPVTWIARTKAKKGKSPAQLYVIKDNADGAKVYLTDYPNLPFEFAVSLFPFNGYPGGNLAPARHSSISTTWGDIKEQ
jgi:hypothetical protein